MLCAVQDGRATSSSCGSDTLDSARTLAAPRERIMTAQAGCGINSVLLVEVLSKVLQHVHLRDRLLSCSLVCSLWRKAAAMSITSVNVPQCNDTKATSLSAWLSTHAAEVKLDSISVQEGYDSDEDDSNLILPMHQLTALRTLKLMGVEARRAGAAAQADAEGDAGYAILMPALPGLTRLDLLDCRVSLKGLHRLTGLQHLAVKLRGPSAAAGAALGGFNNVALLHQAIPDFTHLTALHLSKAAAHDTALVHLSKLTCLQELELTGISKSVTQASFKELPCGLTRLKFEVDVGPTAVVFGVGNNGQEFHFSPSNTPGLCRLTALQELEIEGGSPYPCSFHVDALPAFLVLRKLALSSCPFTTGNGGESLSVLTALTKLEHLEMPSCSDGVLELPADFAALTASPQLTHLELVSSLGPEHALDVFPDDLRLPKLASLAVYIEWLQETETMQRVVDCCPGLEHLRIDNQGGDEIAQIQPEHWAASLCCLTGLSALTSLSMCTIDVAMTTEVYRAIATLTGLQELCLALMDPIQLGPAVQLVSCRQLTQLYIGVVVNFQHGDVVFDVHATNKAPAGSPPDVWRQIPSLVLESAANYMDTGEGKSAAVKSLLRAAAQASSSAAQRESELEEWVEGLEQQVAQLQVSMAAVLQQLQLPAAHHA